MKQPKEIPEGSILHNYPSGFDYIDSFAVELERESVESWEPVAAFFHSSPTWVNKLFALRNKMVGWFGLKAELANLNEIKLPFQVGQKFGLFQLLEINENEAMMGQDDKHLNFRISFLIKNGNRLSVTTGVKINNTFGRLYFTIVKPFHRVIVPIIVKRMATKINNESLPPPKLAEM